MERYDYRSAVISDIEDYIRSEIDLTEWKGRKEELEEQLNEDLWTCDSVTGNASGSYTFSTWEAEENLSHNFELLEEALDSFGGNFEEALRKGAEYCDVIIRCYLLGECIAEVLDDLEEELEEDEEEEEEEEEA